MASRGTKGRGRTSITNTTGGRTASPSHRWTEAEQRTQASRPVKAGAGPRRGDRRDTHPAFTGNNKKTAARGAGPRATGATRKD